MTSKCVLLTGASGFIGRHCLAPLEAAGFEIHAVTSRVETPDFGGSNVHWHRCDLLDAAQTRDLIREVSPSHLLHLSWFVGPGFWRSTENFRWVAASLELFRAFAEAGGRRVVGAGTCAEYDWSSGWCEENSTPLRPATPYGTCKNALRAMLESLAGETELSQAWGRVFFLFGPHEAPSRLVPSVARALLRGQPTLCSPGEQIRDFLSVEDVAAAFVALLDGEVQGAVNIASGEGVAVKDLVLRLAELAGRPDLVRLGALPAPSEPPRLEASAARLRGEVGWAPQGDLETGLSRALDFWRGEA